MNEKVLKTILDVSKDQDHTFVNALDVHGHTALHMSVMKGNEKMIKFLLSHGATIPRVDPLRFAPIVSVARLLLDAGSNPNASGVRISLTKYECVTL